MGLRGGGGVKEKRLGKERRFTLYTDYSFDFSRDKLPALVALRGYEVMD